MAGYYGHSMSRGARQAYINGEMPISKWSKKVIIERIEEEIDNDDIELQCSLEKLKKLPLEALKLYCLRYSSWHHTGMFYDETDFYSLNVEYIESMTDEDVESIALYYKKRQRELRLKKTPEEREAEKQRKAERKAEKALIEEKKLLFKYQKQCKTMAGFLRSKKVDLDKLREVRKKMIAERREELRKIWESQGYTYGLSRIEDDDYIEPKVKGLLS